MVKRAQYKIMQMAFLILAVLIFFVLVFVLFTNYRLSGLSRSVQQLEKESTISSLYVLVNSPELSCDFIGDSSWCVDVDKVSVLADEMNGVYDDYWPVSSLEILEIYPQTSAELIECPAVNCNYYNLYDNEQEESQKYSVYVNLCSQENGFHETCSLAKLIAGVEI